MVNKYTIYMDAMGKEKICPKNPDPFYGNTRPS